MEPKASLTRCVPSDLNGHYHRGSEGIVMSDRVSALKSCSNTSKRKSKLRLNDELVPKPTDVNMTEKMTSFQTVKEHPYSSHMSRFAVFPSFLSPDDPHTGVRAAAQPHPGHFIPRSAPGVTLHSKTFGAPYRHEIIETPLQNQKKAVMWTGECSFWDKGENQVFYPTPPKRVLPNPKLREWDVSLSERTGNMLRNLERAHWITSYQMDYTGSGSASPLKMDDFREKMSGLTGIESHSAALREHPHPVSVPSKTIQAFKRTQGSRVASSTCSPSAAEPLIPSSAPRQRAAAAAIKQHQPPEITALHNEAGGLNPKVHSRSATAEAQRDEPSQEDGERGCCKVRFDESVMSQHHHQAEQAWMSDTEKRPIHLCDDASIKKQNVKVAGVDTHAEISPCRPGVTPRPRVLPGIRPAGGAEAARGRTAVGLLNLQNSFSKTEAHRRFNNSVTRATVDLRDNEDTGRRHNFYGVNCFYLHG